MIVPRGSAPTMVAVDLPWVALGAAVAAAGGAALAISAYVISPIALPAVVVAVAFTAIAAVRPAWGVAGALLATPLELVNLELPSGALSPTEAAFVVVGVVWFARALGRPSTVRLPALRDLPIAVLLLAVAAGLVRAEDPAPVIRVFVLWMVFSAVYLQTQSFSRAEMRVVLVALALAAGCLGVIGTHGYLTSGKVGLLNLGETTRARAVGTFVDANAYASLLVLALLPGLSLAFANLRRNGWLLPVLAGAVAGLAFSLSRGAVAAFAIGLLLLLVWRRARHVVLAAVLVFVLLTPFDANPLTRSDQLEVVEQRLSSLGEQPTAANPRPVIWRTAAGIAAQEPFFGIGVNQFQRESARRGLFERGRPLENAHSIPLSLAAETGLIGLAAFLAFLGQLAARAVRALNRGDPESFPTILGLSAALLAFAVQGLTIVQLRNSVLTAIFFLFAGMLTALSDRTRLPR